MINGLFETHLVVRDLNISVAFYESLGMKLDVQYDKVAFLWFTEAKNQMLGLWKATEDKIQKRHFTFNVTLDDLLKTPQFLSERSIPLKPVFGRGTDEPIVHSWMPAAAYYFEDPDGNELEFITLIDDIPMKLSYTPYFSEWKEVSKNEKRPG